ncbi:MAG: hypothetical protein HQL31_07395 [Planctomycetes bacterium]|nr:hypothetical protein [Planctomycetota bacterium]
MAETRKSFLLRLDPRLWSELQTWADQEMRSVNAQIEYLLKDATRRRRGNTPPEEPGPVDSPLT